MHGSLHIIYASESDRIRRADAADARAASALRRPLAAIRVRSLARGAAGGAARRAAPGTG